MFIPLIEKKIVKEDKDDDEIFYLERKIKKTGIVIKAQCKQTNEGFVVLEGSMVSEVELAALPLSLKKLRDELSNNGEIVDGILKKEQFFNSASYAAAFVIGSSANGCVYWKNKNGITLKEVEESI